MRTRDIGAVAAAQRLAREVVHEAAVKVRPGDREIDVARRIEDRLTGLGVRRWLHTPYAWWGDRTRFARFVDWEPDALPTERQLEQGEPFILDAAPLLNRYPADYAYSGVAGDGPAEGAHAELRAALADLKRSIVDWARDAATGSVLFRAVGDETDRRGLLAIHPLYPAGVLAHSLDPFPTRFDRLPRIGDGFQLPLVGTYAVAYLRHRWRGAPYPFINERAPSRPQGLYAVEPHLARDGVGAKFESILLVDGDETRWLDPDLFGEVRG